MQADVALAPPPNRSKDSNYSPSSATGSDWSGMNGYNGAPRSDSLQHPARGDSISPNDSNGGFDPRPFHRANTFAASASSEQSDGRRGPSENGSLRSRASSRAGSSRASDISLRDPQSRRYQRAESELRQHYAVLRTYLKGGAAQPPRANKARDKLLRLSPVQFHELSTDVFDELQRRQAASPLPGRPPRQDKVPPFLQPRPDFHEKRNQARQKLSSLPTPRFRDLSTDVFCELERRFPHFNPDNKRDSTRSQSRGPGGRPPHANGMPHPGASDPNGFGPPPRAHTTNGSMSSQGFPPRNGSIAASDLSPVTSNEFGRPMPKQFQSNTITPNKSTMVEDEDDDDDEENGRAARYNRSSDAFGLESSLTSSRSNRDTSATSMTTGSRDVKSIPPPSEEMQEKLTDLEHKLHLKDLEIKDLSGSAALQQELQDKLDKAEMLNKSLREEIEKMRSEHASSSGSSENTAGDELSTKHEQLQQDHHALKAKYEQQLKTTEEVGKQFKAQLADIRAIADESSGSMQREEKLHAEVHQLREEAAEWKARYTRAKTQLRNVRMSTIGLSIPGPSNSKALRDQTFYSSDGVVKDIHVTKFQLSIDELLHIARTKEPKDVLDHIKEVVTAVRSITGDVESASESDKNDELARKKDKLKGKVSATANNVITASKNYAAAHGLSPVSLLDAAASHLTAAVVDLLRFVKARPTPAGELNDEEELHMTPVNKNGYFDVNDHVRRPSAADSVYSALSDPPAEHDQRTPLAASHSHSHVNGNGYSGLGINAAHQDDVELEELKVCVI